MTLPPSPCSWRRSFVNDNKTDRAGDEGRLAQAMRYHRLLYTVQ
jgi:hypothetical protein